MTPVRHVGTRFSSQPRAVWAVAFAAVVSFMGLGLVDPIPPRLWDGSLNEQTADQP